MRLWDSAAADEEGGSFNAFRTVTFAMPGKRGSALVLSDKLLGDGELLLWRGRGGSVVGRPRGTSGGGIAAVLEPSDDRLARLELAVDRFIADRPAVGTGRNVGVAGRDVGVGIELVVVVLPAERRDCGRRAPVLIVLWYNPLGLLEGRVGEAEDVEAAGRY